MPRDLLPIGGFAGRCRLSVKALRHYDELGLLRPAHVDLTTGYRYYDRRQAPAAIAIALLRSLDVPLAAIHELLASEDPAAFERVLDRERERRGREIAEAESALRSIERLMRAGTVFPYDVTLDDEPERTALVVTTTVPVERHVAAGRELARELLDRLGRLGHTPQGPVFCLMPPAPDGEMILQMCIAITDPSPSESVKTLSATPVARTRHVGPYEEIGLAEHAVRAWAEENGHEPSGPLREVYRNDPATTPPEALVTDVLLPITCPDTSPGCASIRVEGASDRGARSFGARRRP